MTKLLLRLIGVTKENENTAQSHGKIGKLAGTIGIGCNFLLFLLKLIVGLISGSVSVMADALNNLSDAAASVVTLLGFRLAQRPADSDHPYGHARYEYLSGLAVAAMILAVGLELMKSSVEKIIAPSAVSFTAVTAVILLCSIGLKIWMSCFYIAII